MSMSRVVLAPYDPHRDGEVKQLFGEYPHKDYQLHCMGASKDRMIDYYEASLVESGAQSICLKDDGRLVGLITLKSLPWMSQHFGMRMYAVSHLLARSDGPLVHTRLLRFVIEELPDVDFLDCRIAVDDIHAAHALEVCGFRYVGAEVYLGQDLEQDDSPDPPADQRIRPCETGDRRQVLEIVTETHVHNRFVYDPIIQPEITRSLYRRLVENCFPHDQFRVFVAGPRGAVEGFITAKINKRFHEVVGIPCGSLDFIGVRPETRNRGLGAALNRVALHDMAREGVRYAAVRTLASNYAALRTCFATGFQVTSTSLHFHRWIHRPKVPSRVVTPTPQAVLRFATGAGDS